ncbi:MAG: redoxin domain-containing protein [Acidobacteriia bacterium]|nr:redoxin domain-containing protein [Terriglobia bacterium]
MNLVLILGRLILAGVFALAAITKLADRDGSKKAVTDFGLPNSLAHPLSLLLPLVELVISFLVIFPRSGSWGGVGALALLAIFTVGICVNLARGRAPECHCFGQLHSAPIGWPTLVRNCLLGGCAGLVVWQGRNEHGVSVLQAINDLVYNHDVGGAFAAVVVALAFVAQGWLMFHLFRQHGRMLVRIDDLETTLKERGLLAVAAQAQSGLPTGSSAPSFGLPLLSGEMTSLERLLELGRPVLLIFSDPRCNPCNALLPDVARWEREEGSRLTIAIISRGTVEANRAKTINYGLKNVLLEQDREVSETYYAQGTPSAVLIFSDGSIGSSVVMGAQAIAQLVVHATGRTSHDAAAFDGRHGHHNHTPQSGLRIGQKAPSFRLLDLEEKSVELDTFKGRDTLLLFWNPNCGFCRSMLSDLKAWEQYRRKMAPQLLVVSTGTAESNRAMQLRSTVVLDQSFGVGSLFGVTGTPSAVLVNSEGLIGSTVSVGAVAVLSLAGAAEPLATYAQQ